MAILLLFYIFEDRILGSLWPADTYAAKMIAELRF